MWTQCTSQSFCSSKANLWWILSQLLPAGSVFLQGPRCWPEAACCLLHWELHKPSLHWRAVLKAQITLQDTARKDLYQTNGMWAIPEQSHRLHHHVICEWTTSSILGLLLNTVTILQLTKLCCNLARAKAFLSLSVNLCCVKRWFLNGGQNNPLSVQASLLCLLQWLN